jgi:transketolase
MSGNDDLKVDDFMSRATAGALPKIYGAALLEAAQRDPRIVALTADLTGPTETDLIRDHLPDRYFNVGIAESNMIGIAGGMAKCGDMPFAHSFCVFATRRPFDQIAMQVAYPAANVKIVGFIPGLTTALGVSHQAIDDIALMRALPNMVVLDPRGPSQIRSAVHAMVAHDGPVYMRLKRPDRPLGPDFQHTELKIGRGEVLREGKAGVVFACGMMVDLALEAATRLAEAGQPVAVVDLATVKPLDSNLVVEMARQSGIVVTAENHSIVGGLGSAVAEALGEAGVRAELRRVGVKDVFAEGGTTPYLFERYGLTAEAIVAAFREARGAAG